MATTPHRLFNMLMASNPSDEDVEELFQDLQYVFENPFDTAIQDAITTRKSVYIETGSEAVN